MTESFLIESLIFLFTVVASTETFYLAVAGFAIATGWRRSWRQAFFLFLGATALGLLVTVLKEGFAIERPEGGLVAADGYAFPSGHAAGVMFLAIVWWYIREGVRSTRGRVVELSLIFFVLLIGGSRVWLGVHTVPQVGAGYLVGLLGGAITIFAVRRVKQ